MIQKSLIKILFMMMLVLTLNTVQAELLSTYSFTGANGNEATFEPDNQPNHVTVSAISRGTGLTPKNAKNTFNAQNWSKSTLNLNDYYALTIQPHCGFEMTLTSLTLDEKRSSKGIRNWSIRSSLDNFATDLKVFNVPDNSNLRTAQTVTFNGLENITGPVELRMYGFNAEAGTGTWRIDNVHIKGDITGQLTKIHTIQGSSTASAEIGNTHTIEAIVVGDFQDDTQLKGFFVQEQDADIDDDPTTSEGLFVYNPGGTDVNVGDLVGVTGEVEEYRNLTELKNISRLTICSHNNTVTPALVNLPFNSESYLERYEGMLVNLPQRLTVSNHHQLARYGQFTLSFGRLMVPTQMSAPGYHANVLQAENDLNRIIIDDGSLSINPDPIVYPAPKFSATHSLRTGETVSGLTGVLSYRFSDYRVHPTRSTHFIATNGRTATPSFVGGSLKVASFNVLNYFNGNGIGGGFPTSRGAKTSLDFQRQRQKIISAIVAMQADIIGLMEMENDGYGADSAIQDLVTGLNASTPSHTTYAFINPGFALGNDKIKVALIYRLETVIPVGFSATTRQAPFNVRRPPLAQTFLEKATSESMTVVVNHFKSKGGCPHDGSLNDNQNDGQACWNAERVEAANTLTAWLATDPTDGGDNILIIGDLNAYAKERPITAIKNAGYTDLVEKFLGTKAYSYVYQGQAGTLDHALASPDLSAKVSGLTVWHINADESKLIDYKAEYYGNLKSSTLYNADPYRSSDHDPVIIGFNLGTSSSQTQRPLPGTMGLSVEIDGYGTVQSKPSGINCHTDDCMSVSYQEDDTGMICNKDYCAHRFNTATEVKLIPTADHGSVFINWGGHHDCTDGKLWMINNKLCIAFFDTIHELNINTEGSGHGVVYSLNYAKHSTGIECGDNKDNCSALFSYGTTTFLKAVAAEGSIFIGWEGECTGSNNPLKINMINTKRCIAYFSLLE
jgi:predicted extracellular nuclease